MAFSDATSQIIVSDTLNARVQFFDAQGSWLHSVHLTKLGAGAPDLVHPRGLDVSAVGQVYVVDSVQSTVYVLDASGAYLGHVDTAIDGTPLRSPLDVAVGATTILVADYGNRRVVQLADGPLGGQ